ncbi:MAG: hypothetical protein V4539_07065 [Bacteroidota bacterium]
MKHRIKILSSKQINAVKWDRCVAENANGLIYSSTVYLNAMSKNWHGIVIDDYAAVMALPWKRKLRIRYGYTPPFMQQLGLVGEATNEEFQRILKLFYKFFPLADVNFNFANTNIQQLLPVIPRNNFTIDLSTGYDRIKANYKSNLKENIRKASHESLAYTEAGVTEGITMYHSQYHERMKHIKEKDYLHFSKLCDHLKDSEHCFARAAKNNKDEILAIAVFLKDNKRIYNMMNTTTTHGREKEANHFLLNQVLHEFAGQSLLFDFEGSELPGVREFYENFGPMNQPYFHYHYNGYSWPIKLLKK